MKKVHALTTQWAHLILDGAFRYYQVSSRGRIKRGLYEVAFDGQISLFQGLHVTMETLLDLWQI